MAGIDLSKAEYAEPQTPDLEDAAAEAEPVTEEPDLPDENDDEGAYAAGDLDPQDDESEDL